MKSFLIIGLNSFGMSVATTLYHLGNEVLAVDEDPAKVQSIADQVTEALTSDCRDEAVLQSLGAADFDCVIVALTNDQQASTLIAMMLKDLGAKSILCQAADRLHERLLKRVGADKVVCAESDLGVKEAQSLSSTNILDFIELSDQYSIAELNIPKPWIGKTLRELEMRTRYGLNVVARKDALSDMIDITVSPDYAFTATDVLVIIGSNQDISRLPS